MWTRATSTFFQKRIFLVNLFTCCFLSRSSFLFFKCWGLISLAEMCNCWSSDRFGKSVQARTCSKTVRRPEGVIERMQDEGGRGAKKEGLYVVIGISDSLVPAYWR